MLESGPSRDIYTEDNIKRLRDSIGSKRGRIIEGKSSEPFTDEERAFEIADEEY